MYRGRGGAGGTFLAAGGRAAILIVRVIPDTHADIVHTVLCQCLKNILLRAFFVITDVSDKKGTLAIAQKLMDKEIDYDIFLLPLP